MDNKTVTVFLSEDNVEHISYDKAEELAKYGLLDYSASDDFYRVLNKSLYYFYQSFPIGSSLIMLAEVEERKQMETIIEELRAYNIIIGITPHEYISEHRKYQAVYSGANQKEKYGTASGVLFSKDMLEWLRTFKAGVEAFRYSNT